MHAFSDVRVNLDGRYGKFEAFIGIDDEVGNRAGSVVFRVYVDDVKVYDSGRMWGISPTKRVILNVTRGRELRLLVTDKGDGDASDHADWADARLFDVLPASKTGTAGLGPLLMGPFAQGDRTIKESLWRELVEPSTY